MKTVVKILYIVILTAFVYSQDTTKVSKEPAKGIKQPKEFVDKNGDGFNDNAPDHDGDGIPNGLDKDFIKGKKMRGFRDLDKNGIDDRIEGSIQKGAKNRFRGGRFGNHQFPEQKGMGKHGKGR